jgi:hypothetical protein
MLVSPLAHPLDMSRSPEEVPVGWFAQPATLTFGLASLATLGLVAKLLMPPIPGIGNEQLFAVQTFTAITFSHGSL